MIYSSYLREQKRYTRQELSKLLHMDESTTTKFIQTLKAYGVLKVVRQTPAQKDLSDLLDEDILIVDDSITSNRYYYIFTYVGIITVYNRVLKIYPKYITKTTKPTKELKQVIKVLEKVNNAKEQIITMFEEGDNQGFNYLSIMLYLINDYYENGLYTNDQSILDINGTGEIQWSQTINQSIPLIKDNKPYYLDVYTRHTSHDDHDYFTRLHKIILTKGSQRLKLLDLNELLDIDDLYLTKERLKDLGDQDYILYRIRNELNIQFNARKQTLLKALYAIITEEVHPSNTQGIISMYGTSSFNLVWEKVTAQVFNDQLHKPLKALTLPVPLQKGYNPNAKLIDIIEKPQWIGSSYSVTAKNTLIPDMITITKQGNHFYFVILDAKYYVLKMSPNHLSGQPGIESITKQYLYQQAYKQFIKDHHFTKVKNCFILPTEEDHVIIKGHVSMQMMESLHLENIAVRLLPATQIYDYYLHNKQIDLSTLSL